jgi:hypothetical protein
MPCDGGNCRYIPGVGTELFEAIRAADPGVPHALHAFDRIVASAEPRPDFYEHSVHVGDRVSPNRLTYYFDTQRRGASVAREVGERFVRLGSELGLRVPGALIDFVRSSAPLGREVLQVVVGVDGSPESALRAKYYLVFRDQPGRCVREFLDEMGLAAPTGADLEKIYIVGVDVTEAGVDEVKLYFRLDAPRLGRILANHSDVADLLTASRDVIFLQGVRRPERRQVYVHATSSGVLSAWLGRRGYEAALEHARGVSARMSGARMEPSIVSFPYENGRVRVGKGSVYFHMAHAGSRI